MIETGGIERVLPDRLNRPPDDSPMIIIVHNSSAVFGAAHPESGESASVSSQPAGASPEGPGDRDSRPIVFFDGVCGLCNRTVDFVLRRDRRRTFRFAPLQGEAARRRLDPRDIASLDTIVLIDEAGTHRRSSAVVRILLQLQGIWRLGGCLLWLIPRPVRDLGYRLIAARRYRWFGKRDTCRLPTPEERDRFLQ